MRHKEAVDAPGRHEAPLQLHLRPLARVEEPEGVFHLCGEQAGSGRGQLALRRPVSAQKWCSRLPRASANLGQSAAWGRHSGLVSTRPRTRSARAEALRKGDGLHAPLPRIVISTSTPLLPCSLIWAAD